VRWQTIRNVIPAQPGQPRAEVAYVRLWCVAAEGGRGRAGPPPVKLTNHWALTPESCSRVEPHRAPDAHSSRRVAGLQARHRQLRLRTQAPCASFLSVVNSYSQEMTTIGYQSRLFD
jgi:hypothetical protein